MVAQFNLNIENGMADCALLRELYNISEKVDLKPFIEEETRRGLNRTQYVHTATSWAKIPPTIGWLSWGSPWCVVSYML